ncbi:MAG: helix-turn-helix domain-containing protein [Bacteriovoracaceae bacterium]|nr:helix-turn-helix domain-containing protein [Bacteriovoracaceae bacterium]
MKELEQNWPIIFKAIRSVLGASQYDLSRYTGITQSKIARIEKGKSQLSYQEVAEISKQLFITPAEFASGHFELNHEFEKAIKIFGLKDSLFNERRYVLSATLTPLLKFIIKELGRRDVLEILYDLDLREDIFVIKNFPINLDRFEIFISTLFSEGILNSDYFKEIARTSFCPEVFGEQLFQEIRNKESPIDRLHLQYNKGPHLENFSKIEFQRSSKTNAKIKRVFKPRKISDFQYKGYVNKLDQNHWNDYYIHFLNSFLEAGKSLKSFHILSEKIVTTTESFMFYNLQFDA